MFTYNERDMHRMPPSLKTHLPIKPDIISSGIMEEDAGRESEVQFLKKKDTHKHEKKTEKKNF